MVGLALAALVLGIVTPTPDGERIDTPAVATAQAERLTPPTTTGPALQLGLWLAPYAPDQLTGCDEMSWYRQQWGLPAVFDRIGYRESRCTNRDDVRTSCCHGYWQLWITLHLADPRLADAYHQCDVYGPGDVNSDTPYDKQRQACAAAALYNAVGLSPWQ